MDWGFFHRIEHKLDRLQETLDIMATTLAQLDAAIAAENASLTSLSQLSTQLDTDVAALVTAINNGQDFTNELNAVQTGASTLATAVANVQSADTAAQGAVSTSTTNPPVSAPPA